MLRDINARLVIGECDIAAVLLVLTVTGVFMRVDQAMWLCDVDDAVVPALVLGVFNKSKFLITEIGFLLRRCWR